MFGYSALTDREFIDGPYDHLPVRTEPLSVLNIPSHLCLKLHLKTLLCCVCVCVREE